jgi:hypothetical protein
MPRYHYPRMHAGVANLIGSVLTRVGAASRSRFDADGHSFLRYLGSLIAPIQMKGTSVNPMNMLPMM